MNNKLIKANNAVLLADIARKLESEGKSIIKLQTGDPNFETHDLVRKSLNNSIIKGNTHYSFSKGLPILRKKIIDDINNEIAGNLNFENVVVTHGAVQAFNSTISALLEYGDEVIILEPNWPSMDSIVLMNGGKPIKVNFLNSSISLVDQLENAFSDKTIMLCVNFPNNPTGLVINDKELKEIKDWVIKKDIYLVSDEVYKFFNFSEFSSTFVDLLNSYKKFIFIDSFSKKFAMTGWRIGYLISDIKIIEKVLKASQLTITNIAPFIQEAALEALSNKKVLEYSKKMKDEYFKRLKLIERLLDNLGMEYLKPQGAFYLFLRLPNKINDLEFCKKLLLEDNLCVVPGSSYGESGKSYLRISYANPIEDVLEGITIINKKLNE